jgi:hypothetical protein
MHQSTGHERLDNAHVSVHSLDRRAHCRQIYEQRNAGKILQYDARHDERIFFVLSSARSKLLIAFTLSSLFFLPSSKVLKTDSITMRAEIGRREIVADSLFSSSGSE